MKQSHPRRWESTGAENCYREDAACHDLRLYDAGVDALPLICLSGSVEFGGDGKLSVTAPPTGFPTVGVRGVFKSSGKLYYEVKILDTVGGGSAGVAQIGWCAARRCRAPAEATQPCAHACLRQG